MNRRIRIAILVLLGLVGLSAVVWAPPLLRNASPAAEQDPPAEGDPPAEVPTAIPLPAVHTLFVSIRDAETGDPVAGAAVTVGAELGTGDEAGRYQTTVAHGRSVPVTVGAAGHKLWRGTVETGNLADEAAILEVDLEPNVVTGQVVGMGLAPLPAAALSYRGERVPLDDDGRFVLRGVRAGDTVTAAHPGYAEGLVTADGYPTLYLVLEPLEVRVAVRDSLTGALLPGASVCMDETCVLTGPEGDALYVGAPPGSTFTVEREGYAAAQLAFSGEPELSTDLTPTSLHGYVRDAATGAIITRTIVLVGDQIVPMGEMGMFHATDLSPVGSVFIKAPGYERVEITIGPSTHVAEVNGLDLCLSQQVQPCVEVKLKPIAVRGIYLSYNLLMWDTQRLVELVDMVDRSPILNAIVVDIKSDVGWLAFVSDHPYLVEVGAMSEARMPLPELLQMCKERGIYTIARMVVFKDTPLVEARPELAARHPNGEIFYDREGMAWPDPMREEVWEYNIAVTLEAIELGFDEIQYDYLRFPSDSTSLEVVRALVYKEESTIETRTNAIKGFVQAAKAAVDRTHAFLSLDVFGYALVIQPDHDMRVGQRIIDLAPHADYLCPMVYPSTFESGNLGLINPSAEPYKVIEMTMAMAKERTDTIVRPWLQHYWYERPQFAAQRDAAEAASDRGWCFWNARGTYDEGFFVPAEASGP
jgi:hypothetical protein